MGFAQTTIMQPVVMVEHSSAVIKWPYGGACNIPLLDILGQLPQTVTKLEAHCQQPAAATGMGRMDGEGKNCAGKGQEAEWNGS